MNYKKIINYKELLIGISLTLAVLGVASYTLGYRGELQALLLLTALGGLGVCVLVGSSKDKEKKVEVVKQAQTLVCSRSVTDRSLVWLRYCSY
jgi:hypothetical protein